MHARSVIKKSGAVMVAVAIIAILLTTTASAAPGSQTWYLDSVKHDVTGYVMEREAYGQQAGYVTIEEGASAIWLADEAAVCDVTIPGGLWVVKLRTNVEGCGFTCEDVGVRIGYYDTEFHEWKFLEATFWWQGHVLHIELQEEPVTIWEKHYLALQIENKCVPYLVIIHTEGSSFLTSPCADPGYPLPELPTIALFAAGLACLGGWVVVRRRNRVAITQDK